jgi:hypothetical protein
MKKLAIMVLFCACNGSAAQNIPEDKEVSGDMVVYEGRDNGAALSNPLMGWQCTGTPEEIVAQGIPDEYDIGVIRCSWDRMEPTENGYDFTLVDKAVERLRKDGKTVFMKLYMMPDNVWKVAGYPNWIKQKPGIGNFKHVHFDNLNGNGPYDFDHPDYGSEVWQELVAKFLKQVAQHYPDGTVDVIDSRAYGLYGEWDSNWGNYWNTNSPEYPANKTRVLTNIVEIYKDAFKDYKLTKIAINVSSHGHANEEKAREYFREAALDKAFEAGFAIRFDGVGDDAYPSNGMTTIIKDYFPASPVFAETWYGWDPSLYSVGGTYDNFMRLRCNSVNYDFRISSHSWGREYAYNPNFFANGLRPDRNGFQIGYRILPVRIEFSKEAVAGGEILFSSKWQNTGAGVLYRHYPLRVSLVAASGKEVYSAVCEDFNITRLIKGETYEYNTSFRVPGELAPGAYKVRIALTDNKNAIKMPIGNADSYVIGNIRIL